MRFDQDNLLFIIVLAESTVLLSHRLDKLAY